MRTTSQRQEARRPWMAWLLAATMPVIGVAAGGYVSSAAFGREAEVTRVYGQEFCGQSWDRLCNA